MLIGLGSRHRSRLRILLTREEINLLDSAVAERYAVTRNLLVYTAIHEGLTTFKPETIRKPNRRREVPIWVPRDMKNKIRELAKTHSITQQTILRHLLFQYITQAPWNNTKTTHEQSKNTTTPPPQAKRQPKHPGNFRTSHIEQMNSDQTGKLRLKSPPTSENSLSNQTKQ